MRPHNRTGAGRPGRPGGVAADHPPVFGRDGGDQTQYGPADVLQPCPLDWRMDRLTAVRVSGGEAMWFSSQSTIVWAACTPIPAMSQRTEDRDG